MGLSLSAVVLTAIYTFSDRFSVTLLNTEVSSAIGVQMYSDLDNDGISEKIEIHQYSEYQSGLLAFRQGKIIDQWNFRGVLAWAQKYMIDDINGDGTKEVLIFTKTSDSIYLSCVDPINEQVLFKEVPVCRIYPRGNGESSSIEPAGMFDVNGDGIKEIYFAINTGHETRPRNLFAYYPAENRVLTSPESCAITYSPRMFDIDGDGIPELFGINMAAGNCNEARSYSDLYGWMMVFTAGLDFRFPPVRFDAYPCETWTQPIRIGESYKLLVFHNYKGTDSIKDFLAIYDTRGEPVLKREISVMESKTTETSFLLPAGKDYTAAWLAGSEGDVYKINEDLSLTLHRSIPPTNRQFRPLPIDLDEDGEDEFVFFVKESSNLIIFRNDFSSPVTVSTPLAGGKLLFSLLHDGSGVRKFSVDTPTTFNTFSYSLTYAHRFWFLTILLVLAGCGLIAYIALKLLEIRTIIVEKRRYQLAELQLKSVSSQIDPHFTFNLLESFGSLIDEHDTARAGFIFDNYSRLLKATVLNSDKLMVPLREELDFVNSYIDLEVFRSAGRFEYRLSVEEGLDTGVMIPKMLVHIFVENAVKHGMKHLTERKGLVEIVVKKEGGVMSIVVSDNGIGREKARVMNTFSTGRGNEIVCRMLELCRALYRTDITYIVQDRLAEGRAEGTEVVISIRD